MPRRYFSIGEVRAGPVVLGGFGASDADCVYALLYAHDPGDVEARGEQSVELVLHLDSFPFKAVRIKAFPIDAADNSFFPVSEVFRGQGLGPVFNTAQVARLHQAAALEPKGRPIRLTTEVARSGPRTLEVRAPVSANGVLFLVLKNDR